MGSAADHADAIRRILDRMEAHRDHPGTLPLHDAAWHLLRAEGDQRVEAAAAVAEVLGRHPDHPLARPLGDLVGVVPVPRVAPDLAEVVARLPGLPLREDPAEALAAWAEAQGSARACLEQRLQDLELRLVRTGRLADGLAAAVVALLALAILGWGAASGWFELPPPRELPEPPAGSQATLEPSP